jgi:hypothetical protein
MNKQCPILAGGPILIGVSLILIGMMALSCSVLPMMGMSAWHWGPWRLWPLLVVGVGMLFVVPPFLTRNARGLGGLFIPGVPVLVTGGILLFASVFDAWRAWEWLWPLEVLGVAGGFLLAAIYMRNIWLLIPVIIVGANGLLLQFCAITDWWGVWAVMWTIEPLSVGLALLAVNAKQHSAGLLTAGLALCALAGVGFVGSLAIVILSAIFSVGWLWGWMGPAILIVTGTLLLVMSVLHRPSIPNLTAE